MQMKGKKTPEQVKAMRYMSKIKDLDGTIDMKLADIDSLRAKAGRVSAKTHPGRGARRNRGSRIDNYCPKVADLCEEVNRDVDRFIDEKTDVMHRIDMLPDVGERQLLYMRYFQYMPFAEIAKKLNMSERHVYRMHLTALSHISEFI